MDEVRIRLDALIIRVDAIARQPEAAGTIRTNMILTAAFVEGVALFAVVVCALCVFL